jgi:hypothetical protein
MYIVGGFILVRDHNQGVIVGAYLLVNGLVIIVAAFFERGRYRPKSRSTDEWETTDERFVDDASGKKMVVRYNQRTGERDYVEEESIKRVAK